MKLPVRVEQIEHVVFVVGDVEIALIVKDHAFRFRDAVLAAQKLRDVAVARNPEHFVLLAVAHQNRTVRRQRQAFGGNQSFVLTGDEARPAVGGEFPKPACIIVGKEDVVLRIDDQIFRRLRPEA